MAAAFARLPGVGTRSAARMAQKVARNAAGLGSELIAALQDVKTQVRACSLCGALTTRDRDPCRICSDPGREKQLLCVVEDSGDIALIEQAGAFRGRYHALLGKLSAMRGEGPENPRMVRLIKRVRDEGVREVILALNTDVESDATAAYLGELLRPLGVKISRPAQGLPAGSGIAYADPLTLSRAFHARQDV